MTTSQSDASAAQASKRLLILMRHAKSDWGNESLSDHDRPLNERGSGDAPRMAQWLAEIDAVPDRILSSSATRTRQTVTLMTPEWADEPDVSFSESLYLSTPETILSNVVSDGWDAQVLMVVAHNPGTSYLVSSLAGQMMDMPTAAIAIFEVEIEDWSQLRSSVPMSLIQFMRPKAL